MTLLSIDMPRRPLARALCDHNPFYLLSAMCMLAGLFALNNSLTWSPLPARNLLWLILILNIYELLLIGLGVFLARRGIVRDAATLLVLEAFFLVDAGFLNSELFTFSFQLGLALNVAMLILALVKLILVFEGLGFSALDPRLVLSIVQIVVLAVIPGWLKMVSLGHGGNVPALTFYAVWWIVGSIPVLSLIMLRRRFDHPYSSVIATFVLLPIVSILAHLGTSNWIYHVPWAHANLSPLLLGLAALIGASDYHVRSATARMRLHLLLPAVAIYIAIRHRPLLNFELDGLMITPLRITLLGAAVVYLQGLLVHRHAYFAAAGSLCLTGTCLGHNPSVMSGNASWISRSIWDALWSCVPRTRSQWGIVWLASSFILLGLGLIRSLLRPIGRVDQE